MVPSVHAVGQISLSSLQGALRSKVPKKGLFLSNLTRDLTTLSLRSGVDMGEAKRGGWKGGEERSSPCRSAVEQRLELLEELDGVGVLDHEADQGATSALGVKQFDSVPHEYSHVVFSG